MKIRILAAGLLFGTFSLWAAQPGQLSLKVSRETVPPGGVAQLKFYVTDPKPIIRGFVDMEMSFADEVLGVAVNSPGNDASGTARLIGGRLKFELSSPLATFGTSLDYPVLTIAVRVRPDLPVGTIIPVTIDLGTSFLVDPATGEPYPAECRAGEIEIAGTQSVENVLPGGGLVPAGTPVRILGRGFTDKTKVQVNPAPKFTTTVASANELRLVFAEPVNLRSAKITVRTTDDGDIYYSYLRAFEMAPLGAGPVVTAKPLFNGTELTSGTVTHGSAGTAAQGLALQNSSAAPVTVSVQRFNPGGTPLGSLVATLAPYSRLSLDFLTTGLGVPGPSTTRLTSSAAIEAVGLAYDGGTDRVLPISPVVSISAR